MSERSPREEGVCKCFVVMGSDPSTQPSIDSSDCVLHTFDPRDDMAAFIGHKGLGDEFTEWALAQRVEVDRLLADES